VLGVADAFNRGQDNALVAAVVDRPRVVAEADDRPAADRTDLHRRHGARSMFNAGVKSPAPERI
jgi:hypothetical protein